MEIKIRLPRPCKECEKRFQPTGKCSKVCNDCVEEIRFQAVLKREELSNLKKKDLNTK